MAMLKDGGGGGSTPSVTSNVSVDPGEIRAFAKFLDEMHEELTKVETAVKTSKNVPKEAFGAYDASPAAARKHETTLDRELDNLHTLVTRMGELTTGTTHVSKVYTDLEELNSSNGDAVTLHLKSSQQSDN
ncbi:hypothetical protein ACQBAU_18225 [Propionibacteriaceae bacterium Y2011]|uniref:hypothetical protein n=1 Tax=Microlunatus sp. Y2014 TaxID=3418488 RepID=UPI003B4A05F1